MRHTSCTESYSADLHKKLVSWRHACRRRGVSVCDNKGVAPELQLLQEFSSMKRTDYSGTCTHPSNGWKPHLYTVAATLYESLLAVVEAPQLHTRRAFEVPHSVDALRRQLG
ncbi:hypothetical protein E2C01_028985 [Portunus trituberculatus]|uniref:Uncharacterized protein n=1 Tax=Portunus trituberculatus TaxID=210409 RepID=A0A5B7ELX0_PORTR|nr:hypothetical protein [Portunus trituberculatus]